MIHNKIVKYILPAYWASYLINADASGLQDGEQDQIDAFMSGNRLPAPVDCGEQFFARSNDYSRMGGDVCEYSFLIPKFVVEDFSTPGNLPSWGFAVYFRNGNVSGWHKGYHNQVDATRAAELATA